VVSVDGKGGVRNPSGVMHGDERKRTADDVSKCGQDDVKTGGVPYSRDESGSNPTSGPDGIRYGGGVTMHRALVWNMGTCRRDAKGEREVSRPHDAERTDARHRDGAARTSGDDT
jgi:hypothetical protein